MDDDTTTSDNGATLLASLFSIPADVLEVALAGADSDPDGQVYPWLPGYPRVGAPVLHDGQLWLVTYREPSDEPTAIVRLLGDGHDATAKATRGECRPVTWTSSQEGEYQRAEYEHNLAGAEVA